MFIYAVIKLVFSLIGASGIFSQQQYLEYLT